MKHPATQIPNLREALCDEMEDGNVNCSVKGNLELYCYSKQCVFSQNWNPVTIVARGIVIDSETSQVVAYPFPKFFNVGEREQTWPNEPFEVFEKLDGSLIIAFFHDGEWHTATKGSFFSDQAAWARDQLKALKGLHSDFTYLFEAIYPENRIVVRYDFEGLVLLGAYCNRDGHEVSSNVLNEMSYLMGSRQAQRYNYPNVQTLLKYAESLPSDEEGWVLRFQSGLRLKVKGAEYRRIHALVSKLTPLTVFEAMKTGDDMQRMRADLPEEFWPDFDSIHRILSDRLTKIEAQVLDYKRKTAHLTDKQIGLSLNDYPEIVRRTIFNVRKGRNIREIPAVWNEIRPTGNKLDGYWPSWSVNALQNDL